jgi:hypothetical protein
VKATLTQELHTKKMLTKIFVQPKPWRPLCEVLVGAAFWRLMSGGMLHLLLYIPLPGLLSRLQFYLPYDPRELGVLFRWRGFC